MSSTNWLGTTTQKSIINVRFWWLLSFLCCNVLFFRAEISQEVMNLFSPESEFETIHRKRNQNRCISLCVFFKSFFFMMKFLVGNFFSSIFFMLAPKHPDVMDRSGSKIISNLYAQHFFFGTFLRFKRLESFWNRFQTILLD